MPLLIVRNDITKMQVEAIVNAANPQLREGGGVCGAIFAAAGSKRLEEACAALAPIKTGEAVITPGFDLPAAYIIHTVGPIYAEHSYEDNELLLTLAYRNALDLAADQGIKSIAFPLISSGIYGYPKKEALRVAQRAIADFLREQDMDVYLVVFDKSSFELGSELLGSVQAFIDDKYAEERVYERKAFRVRPKLSRAVEGDYREAPLPAVPIDGSLSDVIDNLDESFADTLFRLIDSKDLDDVTVYKKANIDRKLFSKIRSVKNYMPSKRTIISLAIAIELDLQETNSLLKRAGFTLSRSQKFDVIIEYFITNEIYNIFEINEVLFFYDQALLGGS